MTIWATARRAKNWIKLLFASPVERRHSKVGDAHLWKMKRDFQIRFLKQAGLRPEHFLLDIGCGTLRGGIPLIQYLEEGHYSGIEARRDVIEEGKREVRDAGLEGKEPVLILSDQVSSVHLPRKQNFIWAFSVLIHMKDEILLDCLAFVSRHLEDGGVFYANVNIGADPDREWQGFPVVSRSFDFYQDAGIRNELLVSDIGSLYSLGHISNIQKQDEQRMLRFWKA
jgi:cyclopropane fatty-acyl-phospholipid synthase-like methyltransferase